MSRYLTKVSLLTYSTVTVSTIVDLILQWDA